MSTTTLERTSQAGVVERQESPESTKAFAVIDALIHRADELPDDEVEHRFAILIGGATDRLELHKRAKLGQIEEYIGIVPGADELIDRLHEAAEDLLEHSDPLTSEEAINTVNQLGLASDITSDKELIDKTLDAMHDTQDYTLLDLKRALELARDRDMLFSEAYKNIQIGKHAAAEAGRQVVMSQREEFDSSDPLAKWLSVREVEMPRHHSRAQINEALAFSALHHQH